MSKVLMAVYGGLAYDGRVQRAATSVAKLADVTVLSVADRVGFVPSGYQIVEATLPRLDATSRLLWFAGALLRQAIRIRPDVIYAHDFFLSLFGLLVARLVGARYIYDAHELLIPEPHEHATLRRRFFQLAERLAVARADLIIAANSQRAELMRQHYSLPATPVVIRNIPADVEEPVVALPPADGSGKRIRLVYQGAVSRSRGLEAFIDAMAHLDDRFELVVIGGGPDERSLRAKAEVLAGKHIRFMGKVPRADLQSLLRTCDIGIITYPYQGLNNVYCAANKIFEYAQAGLPMLTTSQPPLVEAVERYGIGRVVEQAADTAYASPVSIAHEASTLAESLDECRTRMARFLADHRWEDEAATLNRAVESVLL